MGKDNRGDGGGGHPTFRIQITIGSVFTNSLFNYLPDPYSKYSLNNSVLDTIFEVSISILHYYVQEGLLDIFEFFTELFSAKCFIRAWIRIRICFAKKSC